MYTGINNNSSSSNDDSSRLQSMYFSYLSQMSKVAEQKILTIDGLLFITKLLYENDKKRLTHHLNAPHLCQK